MPQSHFFYHNAHYENGGRSNISASCGHLISFFIHLKLNIQPLYICLLIGVRIKYIDLNLYATEQIFVSHYLLLFVSLNNASNMIRWSFDVRWQHANADPCMYGLKNCVR